MSMALLAALLPHSSSALSLPASALVSRRASRRASRHADVASVDGAAVAGGLVTAGLGAAAWSLFSYIAYFEKISKVRAARNAQSIMPMGVGEASPAYVAPRDVWGPAELAAYDGSASDDGPILLAADGVVFNVGRNRRHYGPGGEYAAMAGRDASRMLGRWEAEPEPEGAPRTPLNPAERAALAAWVFSFRQKYDVVGSFDEEWRGGDERAARGHDAPPLQELFSSDE